MVSSVAMQGCGDRGTARESAVTRDVPIPSASTAWRFAEGLSRRARDDVRRTFVLKLMVLRLNDEGPVIVEHEWWDYSGIAYVDDSAAFLALYNAVVLGSPYTLPRPQAVILDPSEIQDIENRMDAGTYDPRDYFDHVSTTGSRAFVRLVSSATHVSEASDSNAADARARAERGDHQAIRSSDGNWYITCRAPE
jgi:hypothetical protein